MVSNLDESEIQLRRAFVEVLEVIKNLDEEDKEKIPTSVIDNLELEKDKEYQFFWNSQKSLEEQNLNPMTHALLVDIYREYLSPKGKEELWQKYDRYCINYYEKEKSKKYYEIVSKNRIDFSNEENQKIYEEEKNVESKEEEKSITVINKKGIFNSLIMFIKKLFKKEK